MELGVHAQLIPTHRQFKVQYSTYATHHIYICYICTLCTCLMVTIKRNCIIKKVRASNNVPEILMPQVSGNTGKLEQNFSQVRRQQIYASPLINYMMPG